MGEFAYFTLVGLGVGAIYGLVALSITLLFKGSGLFNFAQGDFLMLGGIGCVIALERGVPFYGAIAITTVVCVAVAAVAGLLTYLPLRRGNYDMDVILLGTIGIAILLENGAALVADATYSLPSLTGGALLRVGSLGLPYDYIVLILVSVVVFVISRYVYQKTDVGLKLRAVSLDFEASVVSGVAAGSAIIVTWIFAGLLGGVGGVLIGTVTSLNAYMGLTLTINGLAGAIIGGLYSPFGALAGGIILGLAEAYASGYGSDAMHQLVGPVLILAILLMRPTGLRRAAYQTRKV